MPRRPPTGSPDESPFDGLGALVPAGLEAWTPLVEGGLRFFLDSLPPARLGEIVATQLALAADAPPEARLVSLLAACPTLHKLGQVLARQPGLDATLRAHLQQLESMPSALDPAPLVAELHARLGDLGGLAIAGKVLAEGSVAAVLPFSWQQDGHRHEGVFKLLKPGIEARLADELARLPRVAAYLEARGAGLGLPPLDYRGLLEQVQELLSQELRLDVEQAHMRQAGAALAGIPGVFVPRLLPWCTPQITAMERVFGPKLSDAALAPGQARQVAGHLISALLARPFWSAEDDALFHGDLHGGNLLLAEDGRVAVLDWSLGAHLAKPWREALVAIALGGMLLDPGQITRGLAALGMEGSDGPAAAAAIDTALDRLVASARPVGFDWLVGLLDALALQGAGGFGGELAVFRKSWLSLAGVIRDLGVDVAADLPLLRAGLAHFAAELPARLLAPTGSRAFATHVSNADLLQLGASGWAAGWRYWARAVGPAQH